MLSRIAVMTFPMERDLKARKMDLAEMMCMIGQTGIGSVDLLNIPSEEIGRYCDAMAQYGIRAYCYTAVISFIRSDAQQIAQAVKRELDKAKRLGAQRLMIVPFFRSDKKQCLELGKEDVCRKLIQGFRIAVQLGREHDMPVCVETAAQDYIALSGIQDCRNVLENVPGLGLVYDCANMMAHGDDTLEYYQALKQYIVYVHLKDIRLRKKNLLDRILHTDCVADGRVGECVVWGQGMIPLDRIITQMNSDGYTGMYALEYVHPPVWFAAAGQNRQQIQAHLQYLADCGLLAEPVQ